MAKKNNKITENEAPKKKHNWKTIGIVVLVICVISVIYSIVAPNEEKKEETQVAEIETEAEIIEEIAAEYQWDPGELAYLNMDRDQLLEIYNDYEHELQDESGWDLQGEEYQAWEDAISERIAEKYDISDEDLNNIFMYASQPNYFATFDVDNVKLDTGDLVYALVNGGVIVIEADVSGGWSNKTQIESNYRNAARFIRDYIGDETYDELQYWAIGDMTDGSKSKYISFTVPSYLFTGILNQRIADKDLGDYVENLYLLPSMREDQ